MKTFYTNIERILSQKKLLNLQESSQKKKKKDTSQKCRCGEKKVNLKFYDEQNHH